MVLYVDANDLFICVTLRLQNTGEGEDGVGEVLGEMLGVDIVGVTAADRVCI